MEAKSQTLINPETVRAVLEQLGYPLIDCGNHWRSQAVYRSGANKTAVQIYKNTGVWTDHGVGGNKPKPLKMLIELSLKDEPFKLREVLQTLEKEEPVEYIQKELIEMQKIYPEEFLKKLFPNYKFYESKGISEETQRFFKVGLAGGGQMYRRMVFPIYNDLKQIVGFSGRRVDSGDDFAKWKLLGKKKFWIYPAYVPAEKTVDEIITESRSVYLVESVGDAMALFEQGIKNVLVIFGTSVSGDVISYLCGKDLDKIYICTNNDFDSSENNGLFAAFHAYIKLTSFFNLDQIEIRLPPKPYNDFGDAHEKGENLQNWAAKHIDIEKQRDFIFNYIKNDRNQFPYDKVKKFLKLHE